MKKKQGNIETSLTSSSSLDDIKQFHKKDLVHFLYYKLLYTPGKIDLQSSLLLSEDTIHTMVAQYLNPKVVENHVAELMQANTSTQEKNQTLKIDETVSDSMIKEASIEMLQNAYHDFCITKGEEIQKSTIEQWDKEFLSDLCINKRDTLKLQKRMMKATENTNPHLS